MRTLALVLWLLSGAVRAESAQPPVVLTAGTESIPLASHVAVLADEKGAWTLADVRSSPLADQFVLGDHETFSYGYTGFAYWYRVTLRNPAAPGNANSDWVLELQRPVLDYLDIHVTGSDGQTQSLLTGDKRHAPPEQLAHRTFGIPLHLAPGEEVVIHVRAQTAGAHAFTITAWTRDGFQRHASAENFAYGAFIGGLLLVALYNAFIFVWLRDRAYLYYVLWLTTSSYLLLSYFGYAREYGNSWFASAPAWINTSPVCLQLLGQVFSSLFTREFLQLRERAPRLYWVLTAMAVIPGVALACYPILGFTRSDQISDLRGVFGIPITLATAGYLALKGFRDAQFYLLAWTLFFVGFVVGVLEMAGLLPFHGISNFWIFSALIGVTVLSLALADRVNTERRERFAAQKDMNNLKSFLPQRVADLVVGGDRALLEPKRRNVTVCVIDLRGFTPFSETSAPEDVMAVLREFYDTMGKVVEQHGGTVEHFAGDSMLIFFNAPLEIPEPEKQAVQTALEMRAAFEPLRAKWARLGHELGLGIGIADGYATIGAIGFSGRSQYAAIGAVTNLASRLCGSAQHGEILTTGRVLAAVEALVESESAGEQTIRGFSKPVQVVRVLRLRGAHEPVPTPPPAGA
jgi:class 3 adenylate cyclase